MSKKEALLRMAISNKPQPFICQLLLLKTLENQALSSPSRLRVRIFHAK